ncbi:N1221-domain-containing protein [Pyrenochaeta sp. DS3sAY3a]|nr:N1221-domain-containing protein [Pyrenochaeta sp. DS3sAY3a]
MENTSAEESLVPPVLDEAELIGNSSADFPVIEAEPEEELNLPFGTVEQNRYLPNEDNSQGQPPLTLPGRPVLLRGNSTPTPAPLHLPPPAPPTAPPPDAPPPDSLSLAQLQSLVRGLPKVEPAPYAFTYDDASSLEEELEEWFSYAVEEQAMLLKTQASFALELSAFNGLGDASIASGTLEWINAPTRQQQGFVKHLLEGLARPEPASRLKKLEALVYILLGCWHETAGLQTLASGTETRPGVSSSAEQAHSAAYEKSGKQVSLIKQNVLLLADCGGIQVVVDVLRSSFLRACGGDVLPDSARDDTEAERREIWSAMTAVYIILEVARSEGKAGKGLRLRAIILELHKPGLLMLLVDVISKMRWDESITLPLCKISLLLWKTMLVTFGGLTEIEKAKDSFRDKSLESADAKGQPLITASPLDYHLFRQEISSKYPAYNPPPPLFPLEPENNSILPPLKNHPNKVAGNHVFGSGLGDTGYTSILHQPVHIATPAPSPPPSPAGPGGKGGKRQSYQTNQMFPFLYPPLDESSNNLGGKGSTDLQDLLVGRKWTGSDIPASILEAAELFAKRMKATRAMKQLWEERVAFMKYERGWTGPGDHPDIEELSLEPKESEPEKEPLPSGSTAERLELVEEFYRNALPNLQSLIIVLIKAILTHVTALVTQSSGANGLQSGFQFQENQNGTTSLRPDMSGVNGHGTLVATNEELDSVRTQEVLDKAVTGSLILILKWFKISHILKFEYITQLLVDSSYVPLILKLLQLQEIERIVNFKSEQEELNFFNFCRAHSINATADVEHENKAGQADDENSDEDDALPPPIRLSREDSNDSGVEPPAISSALQPPEVDELGFPTNELPKEPITNFSWRAFFTSINYLRIMQKICKNKAHRNLMLVSYKSSQFLRKSLKVPQPELRLYTLKLFKNQVPYCGRKWRQSNMRVITAVYLHCRPELRDDWLAGSDVDAEVDESVPLEQALRSLTHWHNLKRYPESLGAKPGVLEEEQDFFRNELEKMDWGDELAHDGDIEQSWPDIQAEGW